MLWDNDQRKFVDGGCTTTRLDDPCLQGLSITPQEVIERIHKAKGPGGRLDLTGVGLREVPSEVWTLTDLADLQLSNNKLTCLSEGLGNLKHLERLGLAGNRLRSLPESIGNCVKLEGLWAHGNVLGSLPSAIGKCEWLRHLMLAGNRLRALPDGIGDLDALEELSVPGNRLRFIPETIVGCASLRTLDLHGNYIETLPDAMGKRCRSLEEVSVQGNRLLSVPDSFCDARRLKRLNVAENKLESLPEKLGDAAMLTQLWVYANPNLSRLPTSLAANVSLKQIWAEGCALDGNDGDGNEEGNALKAYVSFAAEGGGGKRKTPPALLGLDLNQLARAGMDATKVAPFARVARVGVVSSWLAGGAQDTPRGYFKLEKWVAPREVDLLMTDDSDDSDDDSDDDSNASRVLIVAFGSAPGVPNWGGLLKKLRDDVRARGANNVGGAGAGAAAAVAAARVGFDVLYVADTARSWYGGSGFGDGDAGETAERRWRGAIAEISRRYGRVVHLGDSMGASAALLFADLADVSLAFCPQVDLVSASIRPGRSAPWMRRYEGAMIAAVRRAVHEGSKVVVHTGSWAHDVDQAAAVLRGLGSDDLTAFEDARTGGSVTTVTHHVDNHRLALALEEGGELLPIVRLALHEQIAAATREGGDDASSSSAAESKETGGVDDIALKKFNPAVRGI